MFQPSISIIIAVKNAKEHLRQTLASIRQQRYRSVEIIVIDGGSTDGTLSVIDENHDIIQHSISEPDKGISDAFNKGLKLATHEYINFQGAGDTLYHPDCIQHLFKDLDPSFQLVCGKVVRVKEDGITPIWVAPKRVVPFDKKSLLFKMSLPHQALFTHRTFFDQYGGFDTDVRFAMDYELLLRAYRHFPKTIIKDILISRWRAGGIGTNRMMEIFDEYHRIKLKHHVANTMTLKAIDAFTRTKYILKDKMLKMAY
ncbi:MAG: glycosyltransferase family 2 protein [Candidatus Berkiella sp.]